MAITLEQSGRPHSQTIRRYSADVVGRASSIPSLISRATASLRAIRASRSLIGSGAHRALLLLRHLAGRLPCDVLHGTLGLLHRAFGFQAAVLRHPADFLLHATDRLVLLPLRLHLAPGHRVTSIVSIVVVVRKVPLRCDRQTRAWL